MNSIISRRPLGCLQTVLGQARSTQATRGYANGIMREPQRREPAPPTPLPRLYAIANKTHHLNPDSHRVRTAFAVYTTPGTARPHLGLAGPSPTHPHLTRPAPSPLEAHHAYQIKKMDPSGSRTRLFSKLNPDSARVGDVLLVTHKRAAEPFAGVLIGIRRRGIETAILLRGQLTKIGVEMWFKVYSRSVTGIEIVRRSKKRARRAKLTFMRQPKHDMGSVDNIVREWRKSRNVFASGAGKKKGGGKKKRVTKY
ncbi:translation protein SH3-like domain-containing protein [Coniella lustricola]|uniref:Translation protein SH3-like domain-containing protein n=1 Tax=Coniella lustricola TaxID=2025994 RepID=A0A2T2ZTJ6_9PEZI|nr:translation protein SH3-like domain-containing protein [Coniella lustricola]